MVRRRIFAFTLIFTLAVAQSVLAFAAGGEVDQLESIEVNGSRQLLLSRGHHIENPVILFVHGGPGYPLMPYSRAYDEKFLSDFVVVHWDQRNSGKSYDPNAGVDKFSVEQVTADGLVVVEYLKKKFQCRKVILVGHSWGTIIASHMVQARPDDFTAYVSVGTVADMWQGDQSKYNFIRKKMQKTTDPRAQRDFHQMGAPPWSDYAKIAAMHRLLIDFGGLLTNLSPHDILENLKKSQDYTNDDLEKIEPSRSRLWQQVYPGIAHYRASQAVPHLDVRVYFVEGTHDQITPTYLTKKYFKTLSDPKGKEWIEFSHSAHFAIYEEPDRFLAVLKQAAGARSRRD